MEKRTKESEEKLNNSEEKWKGGKKETEEELKGRG